MAKRLELSIRTALDALTAKLGSPPAAVCLFNSKVPGVQQCWDHNRAAFVHRGAVQIARYYCRWESRWLFSRHLRVAGFACAPFAEPLRVDLFTTLGLPPTFLRVDPAVTSHEHAFGRREAYLYCDVAGERRTWKVRGVLSTDPAAPVCNFVGWFNELVEQYVPAPLFGEVLREEP